MEIITLKILLATSDKDSLSALAAVLSEHKDIEVFWAESGKAALSQVSKDNIDLVITDQKLEDMTGLEFAREMLRLNPMVNCAVISDLSPEKFHQASEGLGLVAQVPLRPGKKDSEDLLVKLKHIKGLLAGG